MILLWYFIETRAILLQVHQTRIATGGHLHKYHFRHIWYGRNGVVRLRKWSREIVRYSIFLLFGPFM